MSTQSSLADFISIAQQIHDCERCPLHRQRRHALAGVGSPHAQVLVVDDTPNFHADRQGVAWAGTAGHYLQTLLASINLSADAVFLTHLVRCRPPHNRDPFLPEIATCQPYLAAEIDLIQPTVVVTLGRLALQYFLPQHQLAQVHGRAIHGNERLYFPLYAPAAALNNPTLRAVMEEDIRHLRQVLEQIANPSPPPPPPPPKPIQLALF